MDFGELRSICQGIPTPERWRALLQGLADAQDAPSKDTAEAQLIYARDHIRRWPAGICRAPQSWVTPILRDAPPRAIPLAKTLNWSDEDETPLDAIADAVAWMLQHAPLRHVRLRHIPMDPAHIAHLAKVQDSLTELTLWGCAIDDAGMGALRDADLHALAEFSAPVNHLDASALSDLAYVSVFPSLRHLDLKLNPIGDDGVRFLGAWEALGQLASLNLRYSSITGDGVEMLMRSLRTTELREIYLGGNLIGPEEAGHLARCAQLTGLKLLDLGHTPSFHEIDDQTVYALSSLQRHRGGLVSASAGPQYTLGPDGIAALMESEHLLGLERLDVYENALGPAGGRAIAQASAPRALRWLDVSINDIGDEGAHALLGSTICQGLRTLDLSFNTIHAAGLAPISGAQWNYLEELRALKLRGNPLGLAGIEALAKSRLMGQVHTLDLYDVQMGAQGLEQLVGALGPQLTDLDVSGNPIEAQALIEVFTHAEHLAGLERLTLDHYGADGSTRDVIEALSATPHLKDCALTGVVQSSMSARREPSG